jgi:hypothetical protein
MLTAPKRPVTMNAAASRIADNYAKTTKRTQRGDVGLTSADLGASSLSPITQASVANAQAGRGTMVPAGSDWYPAHGGELRKVAQSTGLPTPQVVVGSGSMSPQNDPVMERAAAAEISRSVAGERTVSLASPSRDEGKKGDEQRAAVAGARETFGLKRGESRPFSQFSPEQVSKLPSHRAGLGGTVNLDEIAKGGTEVATGVSMLRGDTGQESLGPTGKVVSYVHQGMLGAGEESLGEHAPTANDTSEYYRRMHESVPTNHPYHEQPTLFGPEWEADPYGKAHETQGILNPGHQPAEPHPASEAAKQHYPEMTSRYETQRQSGEVKLHEATTPQDTWMMAQALTLPRKIEGATVGDEGVTPAVLSKKLGSDERVVGVGGGDVFMPTPPGTRKLSKSEAQHAIFNEINNRAAGVITDRARAAGRNVGAGVPAIGVQSSTWTGYRMDMGKDTNLKHREKHLAAEAAGNAAAPGVTPRPGQDVPMFDEAGTPTRYASNWRALPSRAVTDKEVRAGHQAAWEANEKRAGNRRLSKEERSVARTGAERNRSFLSGTGR